MKVQNMTSSRGNPVPNQFRIVDNENGYIYFQSYKSIIVKIIDSMPAQVQLDRDTWDYSVTTGKYRNQFLGENKKETQAKIDSGEYILTNLNG